MIVDCRRAAEADRPLLYRLFVADKAAEFAAMGLTEAQSRPLLEMQYRGRAITYAARSPDAEDWIVVLEEGLEVGQYRLEKTPQGVRVADLAILPQWRGRGIGTAVLQRLIDQCRAAQEIFSLRIVKGNPAMRLYSRLGLKVVSEDELSYEMQG